MRQVCAIFCAALPLISGLWFSLTATAHADDWEHQQAYDRRDEGRSYDYKDSHRLVHRNLGEEHAEQHARLNSEYHKAMNQLTHEEQKARDRVWSKYRGNTSDPRLREAQRKIAEKFADKRQQVERRLAHEHIEGHQELKQAHENYHDDWGRK